MASTYTYNRTNCYSTLNDTVFFTDLGQIFHDISYGNVVNGIKTFASPIILTGNAITVGAPVIPSQTVTKQYVDSLNTSDSLQNIVYGNLNKYINPSTNMNTSLFFNATPMNANANYPATGTAGALFSGSYPTTTTITQGNILAVIDTMPNNDLMYTFGASNPVGGMWIAGGNGLNTMTYSFDGIVWYPMPNSPFTNLCCAVAWNGSIWVAMGDGINSLAYSYDGFRWVGLGTTLFAVNTGFASQNPLGKFAWNGRIWVAVVICTPATQNVGNGFLYSYDGITWIPNGYGGLPATYAYPYYGSVTWNGSMFVATGGISGTTWVPVYSFNGIQWYVAAGTASQMYTPAVWNGSYWITHGATGNNVYQSYNGINWLTNPVGYNALTLVNPSVMAYNGFVWLCFGTTWASSVINYSYDGLYWFNSNNTIFTNGGITDCAWNGYMWILCTKYNASSIYTLWYSYTGDATRWFRVENSQYVFSTKAQCVAWGGRREHILYFPQNRTLVLSASNTTGNTIAYSYDGSANWIPTFYNASLPWSAYNYQKTPYLFSSANGAAWNGQMWIVGGTVNTLPVYQSGNTMPSSLNFTANTITLNNVSYLAAPSSAGILFYNTAQPAYSIEAWIRIPNQGATNQNTTGLMGIAGIAGSGINLSAVWKVNNYYLTMQNASGTFVDGLAIGDGNWHHVAVTVVSGLSGGGTFYVDGIRRPLTFTVTTTAAASPFCIGTLSTTGTTNNNFIGNITEVRVWNFALTATQIAAQWNTNVNPNTSGLVGYFSNFRNLAAGVTAGALVANLAPAYAGNTMSVSINTNAITYDTTNVPTSQGVVFYNAPSGVTTAGTISYYPQHTLAYSHVLYQGNTILGNAGNVFVGMGNNVFSVSVNNVQWNGNVWVAVGQGANTIGYSPDGFTWFGLGNTIFTQWGNSLYWNGIYWVAVGYSGGNVYGGYGGLGGHTIAYSPDGIQWTGLGSNIFTYSGNGVAWNGVYWVAVGSSGNAIMGNIGGNTMAMSYNGVTWTGLSNTTFAIQGNDIATNTNGTLWLAAGQGGNALAWSNDGINWNRSFTASNIFGNTYCNSVCYNGRYWIASGVSSGGFGNVLAYSGDGNVFVNQGNIIGHYSGYVNRVVWNGANGGIGYPIINNNYITNFNTTMGNTNAIWLAGSTLPGAAGSAGNTLAYSYNGSQWFPMGPPGGKNVFPTSVNSITSNGSYWIITGNASGGIGNTLAQVTATPNNMVTSGLGNTVFYNSAQYASWNGYIWVAGGDSTSFGVGNTLAYSFNGNVWYGLGAGVFYSSCTFVVWQGTYWLAGGQGGNTLAISYDGRIWTGLGAYTFYSYATFAAWNGFLWVATGNCGGLPAAPIGNTLAISYNGINWTGLNSLTFTAVANSVAWNGRVWVAGGFGGNALAYSFNGNVWYNASNVPGVGNVFTHSVSEVAWNGNSWIAVGSCNQTGFGNTLAISMNGNNWVGLGNNLFTNSGNCIATANLFGGKLQLNSLNQPQLPYRSLDFVGDNYYQSGYSNVTLTINAGNINTYNAGNLYALPPSTIANAVLPATLKTTLTGLYFTNPVGGSTVPGRYITTSSDGTYVTVVAGGNIFVSSNSGTSFTTTAINYNGYSVDMNPTGQYQLAVSSTGAGTSGSVILTSNNYGATWVPSSNYSTNANSWFQCAYVSPTGQYQYVGGGGGSIGLQSYASNNSGASFTAVGGSYNRISAVFNTSRNIIYTSNNIGTTFGLTATNITSLASPVETLIAVPSVNHTPYRMVYDGSSNIFYTTTAKNIGYFTPDFGVTFVGPINLPDFFEYIFSTRTNYLWALSIVSQKLYFSANRGVTWTPYVTNLTNIIHMCVTDDGTLLYLLTNSGGIYSCPVLKNNLSYTATGTYSVSYISNYTLISFTAGSGSIIFNSPASATGPNYVSAPVLLVGGGGGGGYGVLTADGSGGGGAGAVGVGTLTFAIGVTYNITVGAGGTGGTSGTTYSTSGSNSTLIGGTISEIAYGGGYGGSSILATGQGGGNGGSGGGGSGVGNNITFGKTGNPTTTPAGTASNNTTAGTSGTGILTYYGNNSVAGRTTGGGSGGSGAGINIVGAVSSIGCVNPAYSATLLGTGVGGNGGTGYAWPINNVYYGGGGGGGGGGNSYGNTPGGFGGLGGGGNGGGGASNVPTAGAPNTGGGGGAGHGNAGGGAAGGSGIVIVAIPY